MTECPACRQPVSPAQSSCAHCGLPLHHESHAPPGYSDQSTGDGGATRGSSTWLIAGVAVGVGCLLMIVLCGGLVAFAFFGVGMRAVAVPLPANPPVQEAIEVEVEPAPVENDPLPAERPDDTPPAELPADP